MAVTSASAVIAEASLELAADVRELAWIARDQARRAEAGSGSAMIGDLRRAALAEASALERLATALTARPSSRALELASGERAARAHAVRARQAVLAGALVAPSWQSPSIRDAHCPQAGPARGAVTAHHDDYARDRHPSGRAFERRLAATRSPHSGALLTSCGMAATVVALAHLARAGALRGDVLVGASAYHETRDLVCSAAAHAVLRREHPDVAFTDEIRRLRPSCVVLDVVATEHGAAVPHLPRIARALAAARPGAWLLVDTTGAPLAPSPLDLREGRDGRLRVLALESLTKHAQLGLDRVTAGAIYAPRSELAALDQAREHLGANIADASVHALPTPDRGVLARRLARHARNAGVLARRLQAAAPPAISVAHPALPAHPGHARRPATWLTLLLPTAMQARAFIDAALRHARAHDVALVEGASFGLDTTRIYAPSPGQDPQIGFVRISPGIEHCAELPRLACTLAHALRRA